MVLSATAHNEIYVDIRQLTPERAGHGRTLALGSFPLAYVARTIHVTTSKSDASKASKILRSGKASATMKSVAGSDLSQAKGKGGKKGK